LDSHNAGRKRLAMKPPSHILRISREPYVDCNDPLTIVNLKSASLIGRSQVKKEIIGRPELLTVSRDEP
jgi:hypothetical protein